MFHFLSKEQWLGGGRERATGKQLLEDLFIDLVLKNRFQKN